MLFWLHYPGAGPKATLWDEWLPDASLWPAVSTENKSEAMRQAWSETLSGRIMDAEGYVATHQHASIAHQLGWPFPVLEPGPARLRLAFLVQEHRRSRAGGPTT